MTECGRVRPGCGWARVVVVVLTGSVLAGCVSVETIKKREKESEGYYQQGLSVLETDQQRAFVSFQQAIQAKPGNYDAHYALGSIYFLRGEYDNAEREFRTCVKLDPNNGDALNFLGRTLPVFPRPRRRGSPAVVPTNRPRSLCIEDIDRSATSSSDTPPCAPERAED